MAEQYWSEVAEIMNVVRIDFTKQSADIRLARRFSKITGIELTRLLRHPKRR